ncbi:MAG: hypothetical protein AAGA73_00755 [Pseudomonadota bacterium]
MEQREVLLTVGLLSFSQALLGQFMIHGVPLFLRDAGQSSDVVALVYIAAIPYALRFIWGPLIDRYGGPRLGPFGGWILIGQVLSSLLIGGLALSDPSDVVYPLIAIMFLVMVAIGIQQTATSGLMIRHLAPASFAHGAAAQAAGSTSAGMLLGIGVIYLLADLGWSVVAPTLAVLSLTLLVIIYGRLVLDRGFERQRERAPWLSHFRIFRAQPARRLLVLSTLVSISAALPYSFKSILLIDARFSVSQSGVIGIVLGNLAGLITALAVRPLVTRFGGYVVLAGVGILGGLQAIVVAGVDLAGLFDANATVVLVLASNALIFAAFTANRSILMGLCEDGRLATDFATFASMEAVVILIIAAGGAALLDYTGLEALLLICAALSAVGVWRVIALKIV